VAIVVTKAVMTDEGEGGRALVIARDLDGVPAGGQFSVPAGALITPLAREEATARRIHFVEAPPRGTAAAGAGTVAIGADHGGYKLKELLAAHIRDLGHTVIDCGTDSDKSVDYPDFAHAVAQLVAQGRAWRGVLVDGAGVGSCMVANKVPGVRAAMCPDEATAVNSRSHNDANVLTLGAALIRPEAARHVVDVWLATPASTGRHARRVGKIMEVERLYAQKAIAASGGNGGNGAGRELSRLIDHTLLKPDATRDEIARLCEEARSYGFATVCVNPTHVKRCAELLKGSGVAVCTVVGFPLGATSTESKVYEAEKAIRDGATEVDMVANIGGLKSRDYELVERDIASVARVCHAAGAILKVILETALLDDKEKVAGSHLAKIAGADFVKTSTGFGPGGATVEDVALLRRVVGPDMGVKASGGIRTYEDARKMVVAGANRIGASASVEIAQGAQS
jgi:deoxyribose-phosphate aldolase